MTFAQAFEQLQRAGTPQNRKVYARHGVPEPMFGVSYADQGKLAKKAGVDHELAQQLWGSGNHDAKVLAAKVADPRQANSALLESWAKDLDCYVLTDAFASATSGASPIRSGSAPPVRPLGPGPLAPAPGVYNRRRCVPS